MTSLLRPSALAALGALLLAAGCGTPLMAQGTPSGGGSTQPVTFAITSRADAFSDKQPITVTIWDAEQLEVANATSNCSVSMSSDGKESVSCPPGVTYRKPTPETYTFTRAELAKGLTVPSRTVTVGERYRVAVGGKASDDCNSASASTEGTAASAAVTLALTDVAQTLMACVSPPPAQ